ncbi:peptide-binding protein [Pedobacter sp. LMG 31464]|uniref:Peptide-binding protein n=1 Tax=Pedobacter planticolens TaxID=2679964 RepID=A0A923E2A1_9SPHI|nr:aspartyl protease family protein [Pedobacter planticolens]MBB2146244.1 peptide-binding protein [Pedobacter planticolens]
MKYWQKAIKIPLLSLIFGVMVVQTLFVGNCHAQNFTFEGGRKKNTLYFDFIKNLIIIPIYINGKGPFNFILDTGVNPLVITDPILKDSLSIMETRSVKINGFGGGDEIDAFLTNNIHVKVGDASIESISTVIFKQDFFNLSGYVGKKVYGLIGYSFFNSFLVKINYVQKKIQFSVNNGKTKIRGEKIPLEFFDNKPYINIKVETPQTGLINAKVIVDCGASHALSLEAFNNSNFPVPSPNIYGNLGVGLSGEISGYIGRVTNLEIGRFKFKDVLTNFPKYSEVVTKIRVKERNGNLGSDILNRFHVIFDYKNANMYLEKNDNFRNPFDHDMSGIEIYATDKPYTRYFISRLEAGSPAEKAGFLVDDEITAINFKSINNYTLDDISGLFKSNDGQAVVIEIWRNDQTIMKLIKLKRRV